MLRRPFWLVGILLWVAGCTVTADNPLVPAAVNPAEGRIEGVLASATDEALV